MINYPIFLTNMNRITTTKKMVEDLFRMNANADITIIDNASTYLPLLQWYKEIEKDVKIIRHDVNRGPWCFFYSYISSKVDSDYYIYSDADLELNPNMPYNWQEIMFEYLKKWDRKPSLALKISDLEEGELKSQIYNHQSVCWGRTDDPNAFLAFTDMTFSMDAKVNGYRYISMRLAGDFECRHVPWYLDFNNLPEEEIYYLNHIDKRYDQARWSITNKLKLDEKNKDCPNSI
jgi:hypothetical protein